MKLLQRIILMVGVVFIVIFGVYFTNYMKGPALQQSSQQLPTINYTPTCKETDFLINQVIIDSLNNIDIHADSAILIHAESGDILYEKNMNEQLPIASMSKMMTELVVLEAIEKGIISWDDAISISDYAF